MKHRSALPLCIFLFLLFSWEVPAQSEETNKPILSETSSNGEETEKKNGIKEPFQ